MKKIFFLLLLITSTLSAQIQKMSELSKNKYLDSKIIYDDKGEDIWGYFILTQVDKIAKDELKLEFIVLDKNLNKIGSNTFNHNYLNTWLFDAYPGINGVYKNKNELIFAIGFDYEKMVNVNPYAFRKINLTDFSISSTQLWVKDKMISADNAIEAIENKDNQISFFQAIIGKGFLKGDNNLDQKKKLTYSGGGSVYKIATFASGYSFFDLDFNKKWSYEYEKIQNGEEVHYLTACDNNVLVFIKEYNGKAFKKKNKFYYKLVDQNTGNELGTIPMFDAKYLYTNSKVVFHGDNVVLFDKIYEFNAEDKYDNDKCLGMSKRVFNIKSKSVTEQKFMYWTDLSKFIEINKNGRVRTWDYIQFLDIKITSDGKTLMVGEGYEPAKNSKTKNIYTLETDKDFNVKSFTEIAKNKSSYDNVYAWGDDLERMNAFDFMYSQKIKEDEFVYFYQDNEKSNGILKDLKADKWILGIITYADGQFKNQKINLKTKKGNISPMKAKKGYIILQESSKTDNEIRLEKIEY